MDSSFQRPTVNDARAGVQAPRRSPLPTTMISGSWAMEHYVPGCPDPLQGRAIWHQGTKMMKDAFPDLKISVQDMFGVGDKVTVLVRFEGTHQGPFQQFEATGRQVGYRSVEVCRFEGDQIAEEWVAPDLLSLMQQISAAPPTADTGRSERTAS
ncbi:ester cyclase [Streptomyces sp. NBC_00249]|uniref:ester cyclase n=1 Tax=Streptomyces sp. NBC_00249 TaxID=2975690 RepID=UPI0022596608|nr:ester cyclase [Streptomyces sp. NBC_00249]MCX5193591.1 ester cyclase [Streptomyces sp. NBC_00249]